MHRTYESFQNLPGEIVQETTSNPAERDRVEQNKEGVVVTGGVEKVGKHQAGQGGGEKGKVVGRHGGGEDF